VGEKDDISENTEVVIIDDEIKITAEGEIIIDDSDFKSEQASLTSPKSLQEITKIAADGSHINTMFDRYGNKTETRRFDYDSRLKFILLRTSADGQKQVFIYGQNGEVKGLPENMLDKALTAPANDLAAAAGIFEIRRQPTTTVVQSDKPLQPMPSYKFPVQTPAPQTLPPSPGRNRRAADRNAETAC
jgi:hypothetical protein